MKNRNVNLQELRQKMKDLQEQIDNKEKELNIEVGAWVRKETKLDTLHEIQQNFRLVSINNNPQKSHHKSPLLTRWGNSYKIFTNVINKTKIPKRRKMR